MAIGGP